MPEADALVLAGGSAAGLSFEAPHKSLVEVAGKPMIEWVVDALRAAPAVGRIVVAWPSDATPGPWVEKVSKLVAGDGTLIENISAGIGFLGRERPLLITAADLPLLSGQAVEDFLVRCAAEPADFLYSIITREDCERVFPGVKRTYGRVVEGVFTGGNLMLVRPDAFERNIELVRQAYELRKSPVKMAWVLGPTFVLRLYLRRLSIGELERRVSEMIGGPARAVWTPFAEIGFDVDKDSDLELAGRMLREKGVKQ